MMYVKYLNSKLPITDKGANRRATHEFCTRERNSQHMVKLGINYYGTCHHVPAFKSL